MPRLRLLAAAAGVCLVALLMAGPASPGGARRVGAQEAPVRTVTVDPGPLEPGSTATVTWTGFTPGPAYIYICQRVAGSLPPPTGCFGDTLVTGLTKPDRTGSAQFVVRTALAPYGDEIDGVRVPPPGGSAPLDCRGGEGGGNACAVVVTECSAALSPEFSAIGSYDVPNAAVPYSDDPLAEVTWRTDAGDEDGDGVTDELIFADIRNKPVVPPPTPPEEPPIRATRPEIVVFASDLGSVVHNRWRRQVAQQLKIPVNLTPPANYARAIDGVISGAADVAFAAAPADASQVAAAAAAGQGLVYVPISISTIGVGHSIYPSLPLRELRMSARSLSGLLWPAGQPESNIVSGSLAADQGRCRAPASRENVLYTKAGRSESMLAASAFIDVARSKLEVNAPPWEFGTVDEVPGQSSFLQGETGHGTAIEKMASVKGSQQTTFAFAARFALTDTTFLRKYGVLTAFIQNAAGQWVQPSAQGARATLSTSTIGDDNIVDVDEWSPNATAYPMVTVTYAVAPTTITDDFTAVDAEAVREALRFIVSGDGQRIAAEEGFVPLTPELERRAEVTIDRIGSVVPVAPTTTVAPTPTAAPTTTATTAAPTIVAEADEETPTAAAAPTPGNGPSSGTGSRAAAPSSPGPTTPSRPTTTMPGADATATATSTVTESTVAADGPITEFVTPTDTETPPPADNFAKFFDAVPFSPGMPALAAGGASIAMAGQGINLWRVRRRPGP